MWLNFQSTWRPNVVVANTATQKQVNFLNTFENSVKKKTLKIDSKAHVFDFNQLYMVPNVWVLPLEAMLEILKEFSTWRPTSGFSETYRFSIDPCDWTFNLHGANV